MKRLTLIFAVLIVTGCLFSCKNSVDGPAGSIVGKWSIKVDSTNSGIGPIQNTNAYVGQPGDYYDFRSNNKLYIKEGNFLDTFAYNVAASNKLTISEVGSAYISENCFIDAITNTTATINFTPYLFNPGGNTTKVVYLVR